MNTSVSSEIETRPDLSAKVKRSTEILGWQMGPSAARSTVEWTLTQDHRGQDVIELRVSDWTGSVGYRFALGELDDPNHMQNRLHRLWGDLLMVRSHVQMDGHLGPYQGP